MLDFTGGSFGDIPYTIVYDPENPPKAMVMLYHGWGSSVERQLFRAQLLAGFGYRVVIPELVGHGRRGNLDYAAPESAVDFLQVLLQSIEECDALFDAFMLPQLPRFLVGHSLGGMIALGLVARLHQQNKRLDGVAAMNSSANWRDLELLLQGVYSDPTAARMALASERARQLRARLDAYDPTHWQARGITTPVLLTNGTLDTTVPAALNAAFCAEHPLANVRQEPMPESGHCVSDRALEAVVQFIQDHRPDLH